MQRRSLLKLIGAGALAAGAPLSAQPAPVLIYDRRFAQARAFAAGAAQAYDCSDDAARLWYAGLAGRPLPLIGLTTWADAMILSDLARRDGRALRCIRPAAVRPALRLWQIGV